jgi:hypothetical protein
MKTYLNKVTNWSKSNPWLAVGAIVAIFYVLKILKDRRQAPTAGATPNTVNDAQAPIVDNPAQ